MRSFRWLLLLLSGTTSRFVSAAAPPLRWLEDAGRDYSQSTVHQGNCFRMKIVGNNDDDGNSYFYNGAYRAQYERYISYYICESGGTCQEYVSDLEAYLEQTVVYVESWCSSCAAQCRRRLDATMAAAEGGRQLDENADAADAAEEETTVNCKTCASDCKLLNTNKGNSGMDESGYLACQAGNYEGDIQYYTAPQCENGRVVIGHFYDNECTIKTNTLTDVGFSYNTFQTIENIEVNCSVSNACANLVANSVSCDNSANGQQDSNVCKASAAAGRVYTYYTKPFFKEVPIGLIVFLVGAVTSLFGFLSYTYYVHHSRTRIPMATLDAAELPEFL